MQQIVRFENIVRYFWESKNYLPRFQAFNPVSAPELMLGVGGSGAVLMPSW